MISTASKCDAASAAYLIMSTAPIEKLGTTSAAGPSVPQIPRSCSRRSGVKPDVPTTAARPFSRQAFRLSRTTSGWAVSTTTSASTSEGAPVTVSAVHFGPGPIRVVERGELEIVGGGDRVGDRCRQLAAGA